MRPSSRLVKTFDGNVAHSTGYWWYHAGAIYSGGSLYYSTDGKSLVYNAGRDFTATRNPCLVDKCKTTRCDDYCTLGDKAWNKITNTKTYLVPSVGIGAWSGRWEMLGYDAHDVGLAIEGLSNGFWIDNMLVECRTGEDWAMPTGASPNKIKGDGFYWYDTFICCLIFG